jgi:Na+-translocating ferredoxin:NAD+ oxidoreductase RnfC subunit
VVCPAKLPLMHYFRIAKSELKALERERKKANMSRLRSETRQQRLEKIKREQEERKARRKASSSKTTPQTGDTKQSFQPSSKTQPSIDNVPEAQRNHRPWRKTKISQTQWRDNTLCQCNNPPILSARHLLNPNKRFPP